MYKVIITKFGRTHESICVDLTDANFTILEQHAKARDLGMVQGIDYEVELIDLAEAS